MSVIGSNILAGASGQGGDYTIARSLRFRDSASAYLSRTPASAGNRKTWTWSAWVKRGSINRSGQDYSLFVVRPSSTPYTLITFRHSTATGAYSILFEDSGSSSSLATSSKYRDPSAWYHIVIAVDTTQATSSNRVKIYVNNQQITSWDTYNTFPSLNADTQVNSTNAHNIGRDPHDTANLFDGYMTEVNFIDGQALTPSSFGAINAQTGVWQPKRYAGTYGTNGFYLPFTDNSALTSGSNAGLGKDFSGNGNYWNTNNISITSGVTYDSMTDVPTLTSATASNFCTLNPISNPNGTIVTYSDGNLAFSHSASSGNAPKMTVQGTMALPAGKFYWEYTVGATVNDQVGIGTMLVSGGSADGTAGARYLNGGTFQSSYTTPSSAASYTTGDVIGMAYDQPNGTLAFYKNNSLQGTVTNISTSEVFFPLRSPNSSGSGGAGVFNFGQRPFAYTPPTGFQSLNTFNLPTPTIGATASTQANKYFDATLYTGNGSTQTITNAGGFQPDFVWIKKRDTSGQDHVLQDAVRGFGSATKLASSSTAAENNTGGGATDPQWGYVTSAASNGFNITASTSGDQVNKNAGAYAAWQWRANGSGVTNTAGSITSTVSANTSAGFSVVTYTGTGSAATVGHGLGVAPSMIIIKSRTSSTYSWAVYHAKLANPSVDFLFLDQTIAAQTDGGSAYWNSTNPTSSVFSLGTDVAINRSAYNYVAYCFAEVAGYSKFGSYTGNGSSDGPFIFTGFKPKYVLIKRTNTTGSWVVWDSARTPYNATGTVLYPNYSQGEDVGSSYYLDLVSNGIKIRGTDVYDNANGSTYIYMAFASNPFKYSLGA